jgi:hypothetical protein
VARVGVPTLGDTQSNTVLVNGVSTHGLVVKNTVWVENVGAGTHDIERCRHTVSVVGEVVAAKSHDALRANVVGGVKPVRGGDAYEAYSESEVVVVWARVIASAAFEGLQWLVTLWWALLCGCGVWRDDDDDDDARGGDAEAEYTPLDSDSVV